MSDFEIISLIIQIAILIVSVIEAIKKDRPSDKS